VLPTVEPVEPDAVEVALECDPAFEPPLPPLTPIVLEVAAAEAPLHPAKSENAPKRSTTHHVRVHMSSPECGPAASVERRFYAFTSAVRRSRVLGRTGDEVSIDGIWRGLSFFVMALE
jgi:hypothetical protein